jgi:indole-3-glycerol phosphate synthase
LTRRSSGDFLDAMAEASRRRVSAARAERSERELRVAALASPLPPPLRLSADGFDIIAEIKLQSPALGVLADAAQVSIADRAARYAEAGAAAVSVLTEPSRFDGRLAHLREAADALTGTGAVAMRKDFLVDPWQVFEAREAGAGGVLLIVRMLDDATLDRMLDAAAECGLFVLLEAFDEIDLSRIRALPPHRQTGAPPLLAGLNTRDLRTLEVDTDRLARCRRHFPARHPAVAESGLETAGDVARAAALGYRVALIGSALMRTDAPDALIRQMLEQARACVPAGDVGAGRSA